MKKVLSIILSLVMVLTLIPFYAVPSVAEENQPEPVFSVSVSGNTFTISRTASWKQQTVNYTTVSVTAVEGIHFTAAQGTLSFAVGETSKSVTVTETAVGSIPIRYRYQTGSYREYRLDVLDDNGYLLASGTRRINYGDSYKFNNTYVNSAVTTLLRQDGTSETGSYIDVTYNPSNNTFIQVKDSGYKQAVHDISTASLFSQSGVAPREYLSAIGDKIYAAVRFEAKEENDGYQYIQILADNSTAYDGDDPNGNVDTPSLSYYKACFERDDGSNANSTAEWFSFPHRYDYKDKTEEDAAGLGITNFSSADNYLYAQKYRNDSVRTDNSGAILLDPTVGEIDVRFDAAGSGSDTWDFRNLKARFALGDETAPYPTDQLYVSRYGSYHKHGAVTVTICFNEIVIPYQCVLKTTWGDLPVISSASRTNVLSFSGPITANAGTALKITGIAGTVKDLLGHTMTASVSKTMSGYTVAQNVSVPSSNGVYLISNAAQMYGYAQLLESNPSLSARLMADIDMSNSQFGDFKAMAGTTGFSGTFDGNGHKIINLNNVSAAANGLCGLFGYISAGGRVQNLDIEISFTAPLGSSGAICGFNLGTVENCIVSGKIYNSIADSAQSISSNCFGGVVGDNRGNVIHCLALNEIWNRWQNLKAGGIVGYNSGTVESCCFNGVFSSGSDVTRGAVCGENAAGGTVINCAARNINTNYYSYAIGTNNGTATNTLYMSTSDFMSGKACYEVLNNGVSDGTQFWYQNLDNEQTHDDCPKFSGGTVYKHGNIYTNAIVHTLSHIDAVAAGCENAGRAEYWVCTVDGCGKIFADENAQNETTLEALTLSALGHDWQSDWSKDDTNHWHRCSRCSERIDEHTHSLTDTPVWDWNDILSPKAGFACSVCDYTVYQDAVVTNYSQTGNQVEFTASFSHNGNAYTDTATADALAFGENTCAVSYSRYYDYFFVPSEDGYYMFTSTFSVHIFDVKITILDENGNQIGEKNNYSSSISGFNLTVPMESGKLYIIRFSTFFGHDNIPVTVIKTQLNSITVDSTVENGRVWAEDVDGHEITEAFSETGVRINFEADDGYRLEGLTVSDANGNPVDFTNMEFDMPYSDLTVSAVFASAALELGENTVFVKKNEDRYYTFTPPEDGNYVLYSVGPFDPTLRVYDGAGNLLGTADDYPIGDRNVNLTVSLEGGSTYTIDVYSYEYNNLHTGLMTMYIQKAYSRYDINEDGLENFDDVAYVISASVGEVTLSIPQREKADCIYNRVIDGYDAAELYRVMYSVRVEQGDINRDGTTDLADYAMVKAHISGVAVDENTPANLLDKSYLSPEYDSIKDNYANGVIITMQYYAADMDYDRVVDAFDLFYLDKQLNNPGPEPSIT